jgi:hypothetical protein
MLTHQIFIMRTLYEYISISQRRMGDKRPLSKKLFSKVQYQNNLGSLSFVSLTTPIDD